MQQEDDREDDGDYSMMKPGPAARRWHAAIRQGSIFTGCTGAPRAPRPKGYLQATVSVSVLDTSA